MADKLPALRLAGWKPTPLGGAALLFAAGELFEAAALGFGEIGTVGVVVLVFVVVLVGGGDVALGDGGTGFGGGGVGGR